MVRNLCLLTIAAVALLQGQTPCSAPQGLLDRSPNNFFTREQEVYLGDVIADQIEHGFRIVDAPALLEPLNREAAQLRSVIPSDGLQFRFSLIDLPQANAFALPGGRIYVSRKLIAAMRDDNELAAILAHEMGHILAGQSATTMSGEMRRVLKIDKVTDRQDVAEQYSRLFEEIARSRKGGGKDTTGKDQVAADRIGLYLLAAAGYNPEALPKFLDRLEDLKGDTGNFFTDLFGVTRSESKRLREMLKNSAPLQASCIAKAPVSESKDFVEWQTNVAEVERKRTSVALPGLVSDTEMAPKLTASMSHVRFSPDGSHVLAQDGASIHVFTVSPLALQFEINAVGARPAEYTPDGQEILFATNDLRVERWSVAAGTRTLLHEVQIPDECVHYDVSPDGAVFACFDPAATIRLISLDGDEVIFEHKHGMMNLAEALLTLFTRERPYLMSFSPDGKYFAGSPPAAGDDAVLFDLTARKKINVSSALRDFFARGFIFLSNDRILAQDPYPAKTAAILEFPGGKVLSHVEVNLEHASRLSNPDFVLVRPLGKYTAAIVELASKNIVKVSSVPGIDQWQDRTFVERGPGDLALYGPKTATLATTTLHESRLPPHLPGGFSSDLARLAVSTPHRGIVWEVEQRNGGVLKAFDQAAFSDANTLWLTSTRTAADPRSILKIDLKQRAVVSRNDLLDDTENTHSHLVDGHRWMSRHDEKGYVLEMQDPYGGRPSWTRPFEELPKVDAAGDSALFSWPLGSKQVATIIGKDAKLQQARSKVRNPATAWLVQVVNVATGDLRWQDVVDGLYRPTFTLAGDHLLISSPDNRLVLRRWTDNTVVARTFGHALAFHKGRARLAVQNIDDEIRILDMTTGAELRRLQFPASVVLADFSANGDRLAVLTADQHVLTFSIP